LTQRSHSLVHKDEFVKNEVEMSTFINEENDVLIMLKADTKLLKPSKFLVFSQHGILMKLIYDNEKLAIIKDILTNYNLT
jgi:hypothetical protein